MTKYAMEVRRYRWDISLTRDPISDDDLAAIGLEIEAAAKDGSILSISPEKPMNQIIGYKASPIYYLVASDDVIDDFKKWVSQRGGTYSYNKSAVMHEGILPKQYQCWCEVIRNYFEDNGFSIHTIRNESRLYSDGHHKFETYIKE